MTSVSTFVDNFTHVETAFSCDTIKLIIVIIAIIIFPSLYQNIDLAYLYYTILPTMQLQYVQKDVANI